MKIIKRLRPPFKIHGGKFYLSDWVIRNFPDNYEKMRYIEPFGGAASVLINKTPSVEEVYNDLHQPTANIFSCLVNNSDNLIRRISEIEYCEKSFEDAKNVKFEFGNLESAVAELVLRRMSRGGIKKVFSWSNRKRGGRFGDVNAWETFKDLLPVICRRISGIKVFSKDALSLIQEHMEDKDVLFYLDPPYVTKTRTSANVYDCEMTDKDHRQLADFVKYAKCKIAISGYDGSLYRELYGNWRWLTKDMPNNSGQGKTKQRRVECLIVNY